MVRRLSRDQQTRQGSSRFNIAFVPRFFNKKLGLKTPQALASWSFNFNLLLAGRVGLHILDCRRVELNLEYLIQVGFPRAGNQECAKSVAAWVG